MSKRIFAAGATCFDWVVGDPTLKTLGDLKTRAKIAYMQAGGGGANFAIALHELRNAYHEKSMHIALGTRIGKMKQGLDEGDHSMQELARKIVQQQLEGIQIVDAIVDEEYLIPINTPVLWEKNRQIFTCFNEAATCLGEGAIQDFNDNVSHTDLNFINTRLPTIAMAAAHASQKHGVPYLLDYSIDEPEKYGADGGALIDMATYVVAPSEARIKGQGEDEPLFDAILRLYPHVKHLCVSGGLEPIKIYSKGKITTIEAPEITKSIDKLGVGDARNAALALFLLRGDDFVTAIRKSSAFASFTIRFPGRSWKSYLQAWVDADPNMTNPDYGYVDRETTIKFPQPLVA